MGKLKHFTKSLIKQHWLFGYSPVTEQWMLLSPLKALKWHGWFQSTPYSDPHCLEENEHSLSFRKCCIRVSCIIFIIIAQSLTNSLYSGLLMHYIGKPLYRAWKQIQGPDSDFSYIWTGKIGIYYAYMPSPLTYYFYTISLYLTI